MSLVETVSPGSSGNYESSTGAEMATELSRLRKNLEGVALKGKRMAASRPGRDECRRRHRIVRGEKILKDGRLAGAVHL